MDSIQTLSIKNQFDIVLKDSSTGKVKSSIRSYNTLLGRLFERLCNLQPYFTNIQLGSGSGTVTTDRIKMFNRVIYKTASVFETGGSTEFSQFYVTKMITINPDECNGVTFREVAIGYGNGSAEDNNIVNLSKLTDYDGNPVEITKTANDILEIYATIYFMFIDKNSNFRFVNLPEGNQLYNYFVNNRRPSAVIQIGGSDIAVNREGLSIIKPYLSKTTTWIPDVPNGRVSTAPVDIDYNEGNGNIWEIGLQNISRYIFPNKDIDYQGHQFNDVFIMANENDMFVIPTTEINKVIDVKKDGVLVEPTEYTRIDYLDAVGETYVIDSTSKYPELQVIGVRGISIHPDLNYMAIAGKLNMNLYGSGFLYIYEFYAKGKALGRRIKAIHYNNVTEAGDVNWCRFDNTGNYLMVAVDGVNSGTKLLIYKYNKVNGVLGDLIETPLFSTKKTRILKAEFSSDSKYLVAMTNRLHIYKFDPLNGLMGVEITPPTTSTEVKDVCFTADFKYLAIAFDNAVGFKVYQFNKTTETYTELAYPTDGPTKVTNIGFIDRGIILGLATAPYLIHYDFDYSTGIIGNRQEITATLPTTAINSITVSNDKRMMLITEVRHSYWGFYTVNDNGIIDKKSPTTEGFAGNYPVSAVFSKNDEVMGVGLELSSVGGQSHLRLFDMEKNRTKILYENHEGKDVSVTYNVQHIPKTNLNRVRDITFSIDFVPGLDFN